MRRTLLTTTVVWLLALGCGRPPIIATPIDAAAELPEASEPEGPADAKPRSTSGESAAAEKDSEPRPAAEEPAALRAPGDFVTYRFSGAFRKGPLALTQRIVAREGDTLVVDVTLADGRVTESLRVRMSDAPATRGEVLGATWIDRSGVEQPASIADYEALMSKTSLAADANEEDLGEEAITLAIGGAPLACRQSSFRVRIGNSKATMRTIQSDRFPWGDVGGEITAEDGRVLYRAEVIDAGHAAPDAPVEGPANAESRPAVKSTTIAQWDYDE